MGEPSAVAPDPISLHVPYLEIDPALPRSVLFDTQLALDEEWLHNASGYKRALELQRLLKVPLIVYFYTDWCLLPRETS